MPEPLPLGPGPEPGRGFSGPSTVSLRPSTVSLRPSAGSLRPSAGSLRPIVLTAFGPFPGCRVNPTGALARAVARALRPAHGRVEVRVLPTTWGAPEALVRAAAAEDARAVIALGFAAQRTTIDAERWAVNATGADTGASKHGGGSASRADAAGRARTGPLDPSAPARLEGVLHRPPFASALDRLVAEGLPIATSDDAGRYLCNAMLFALLHARAQGVLPPEAPVGFVHIPPLGPDGLSFDVATQVLARWIAGLVEAIEP